MDYTNSTRPGGAELPAPRPASRKRSRQLLGRLREEIACRGSIGFARFMERALYAPGLGYYDSDQEPFGPRGDFITAPELGPLFARCLARQCAEVLAQLPAGAILELGAGSGALACDLLSELRQLGCLPSRYLIRERSASLRRRQAQRARRRLPPACRARIEWLQAPPAEPFQGLILANEVLDALPVHRVRLRRDGWRELRVVWRDGKLAWQEAVPNPSLRRHIERICGRRNLAAGYVTELNCGLHRWLRTAVRPLQSGILLCMDYGYPRAEYLHPQRSMGTLLCHYRHRFHDDPLLWPGLQDITASVDFTLLAEAGKACGLDLYGYADQAWFLLGCGLDARPGPEPPAAEWTRQARQLLLPGEMGTRFQVAALGRGVAGPLTGFRYQNRRECLAKRAPEPRRNRE